MPESQPSSYAASLSILESLTDPAPIEKSYSREPAGLQKDDIVICYPLRSGIGMFNGSLSETPAPELGTMVVSELLLRTGRADIYDKIDSLIAGNVIQDGMNPAGQIKTKAGLRESASAYTINMACGSGLKAIMNAATAIMARRHTGIELAIAGGFENMSRAPSLLESSRKGFPLGGQTLKDGVLASLTDAFEGVHMGITAERLANLADRPPITRTDADRYALRSQRRAAIAQEGGYYQDTIVPLEVLQNRKKIVFQADESIRGRSVTLESLAAQKPAFQKDGMVTAGNASGISDGAAFMIVTTAEKADELGLEIAMKVVAQAEAGVAPGLMGLGPISSTEMALGRAGLSMADLETFELNEAFANVALACGQALGATDEQLNPLGGAIAMGHPIGATGGVLVTKIASFYKHNPDSRYAAASLCIGGGQGITGIFENVNN